MNLKDITIYHKNTNLWEIYHVKASVRNTSYLNRNKTGVSTSDNALIRVFDDKNYEITWKCVKGDVIVDLDINDVINQAPLTELRNLYGKEHVYEVTSIDKHNYDDIELESITHIKIGGK